MCESGVLGRTDQAKGPISALLVGLSPFVGSRWLFSWFPGLPPVTCHPIITLLWRLGSLLQISAFAAHAVRA
jgi:hypothetical protein